MNAEIAALHRMRSPHRIPSIDDDDRIQATTWRDGGVLWVSVSLYDPPPHASCWDEDANEADTYNLMSPITRQHWRRSHHIARMAMAIRRRDGLDAARRYLNECIARRSV